MVNKQAMIWGSVYRKGCSNMKKQYHRSSPDCEPISTKLTKKQQRMINTKSLSYGNKPIMQKKEIKQNSNMENFGK